MNLSIRRTPKDGEPKVPDDSGIPPLTRWERYGAAATAVGGVAVGGLGFYASFGSVSAKAAQWGFTEAWVLPAAIDTAIPVFTGAYLFLIRTGMPLWWARLVPWALSLITCALNVASGNSLWSKVAHGSMSLLWVAVSEIAAHIYAVRIGAATGRRRQMDKVRWARWLLAFPSTFRLWRRMKLWELTSYDEALGLEQKRLAYEALLRSRFGRAWRRKAPVEALMPLRLARVGVPLEESIPDGLRAAGIEPTGVFAAAVEAAAPVESVPALAPAPAPVPVPAPAPVPAAVAPAAPAPVPVSVPAPAAVVPAAGVKPRVITVNASAPSQEVAAPVEPSPSQEDGPFEVPAWSTEEDLRVVLEMVLNGGHRDVFDGPLTGAAIAETLGQSEGNGRKVRARLIKEVAAAQGVQLPQPATVDAVFTAFAHARTPVGA
ncbi:DUF2637 domain-containing protein [Streptomyces zaomyceticus]|uniref:DUF2637 domain-containing protein n=1 Tax=Streptomyces zaomyceticus TaxID=68286 RepID=UPI002E23829A